MRVGLSGRIAILGGSPQSRFWGKNLGTRSIFGMQALWGMDEWLIIGKKANKYVLTNRLRRKPLGTFYENVKHLRVVVLKGKEAGTLIYQIPTFISHRVILGTSIPQNPPSLEGQACSQRTLSNGEMQKENWPLGQTSRVEQGDMIRALKTEQKRKL